MLFRYIICISVLVRIIESCIPTQQVEYAPKTFKYKVSRTVAGTYSVSDISELAIISPSISNTVATATTATTSTASTITTTTTADPTTTAAPTSTTTTTTTTTTTYPITTVYPCSHCSPIYDSSCQGYQKPSASSYCLTSDEVPVTYTLGPVADHGLPANTCSTRLGCPSGTVARVNIPGSGFSMGNADGSPTLTYCSEMDGMWYSDVNGYIYGVTAIACQYP